MLTLDFQTRERERVREREREREREMFWGGTRENKNC